MIQFSGFQAHLEQSSLEQDSLEQANLKQENARLRAELERARSELAHLARVSSLGTLAAAIAHEVTQPLTGVIINAGTCTAMLGMDPPNVISAGDAARRIMRDAHRACEVIARLRALFDKRARTLEVFDLNEAAREVATLSSSELCRAGVILRQDYTDPLPPVSGDRVQLQQVILNLLLNATDAMRAIEDRPRLLTIRTQPDGADHVSLIGREALVSDPANGAEDRAGLARCRPHGGDDQIAPGMDVGTERSRDLRKGDGLSDRCGEQALRDGARISRKGEGRGLHGGLL